MRLLTALLLILAFTCQPLQAGPETSQVILGKGTNLAHWLSQTRREGEERRNFILEKDIAYIAELGFDHVRMPIDEMRASRGELHPEMTMITAPADAHATAKFTPAPDDLMADLADHCEVDGDRSVAAQISAGEQTDVAESADWYHAKLLAVMGSNLNMTRTPDCHFLAEGRHNGTKLWVFSPDFNMVSNTARSSSFNLEIARRALPLSSSSPGKLP